MCRWFDLEPLFLGRLRLGRLNSNQIASQHRISDSQSASYKLCLETQFSSPSISLGPNGRGLFGIDNLHDVDVENSYFYIMYM